MQQYNVEMAGITKRFGNVLANDSIDLKVRKGTIHAIVGENGAGKSTLMNILYGIYKQDSGSVLINGEKKTFNSPADAISSGIGMVHQHFMLVGTLTVLENIILGNEDTSFGGLLNLSAAGNRLNELIKTFGLKIDLNSKVETLPVGIQQKIEILKVLFRKTNILIFDEPTAVLTPQETDELFELFKTLREEGKTIILITHKLGEVISISDTVTVLRHGKAVAEKKTSETGRGELAELIVGGLIPPSEARSAPKYKEKILEVKDLIIESDRNSIAVNGVSFDIYSGEIFGIAGVEGSGQSELVEAICGLREVKSGKVKITSSYRNNNAKAGHVAHIPADRHKHGIIKEFNLYENVLLGRQNEEKFASSVIIKERSLINYTKVLVEKYDVRPGNVYQDIAALSGGNQQKLVVSRELSKETNLIIASHPTRGLDIKASSYVLNTLTDERNRGKAVLLVSSDLTELLQTSDRIAVMYEGKVSAILHPHETNERNIGMYMTGTLTGAEKI